MKKFTTTNLVFLLGLIKTLVSSTATSITNAYEALVGPIGNDSEGNKHTVKSFVEAAILAVNGAAEALEARVKAIEDAKGVANGFASLDANGHVPAAQLPSFVDDVIEAADLAAFPAEGETGKIYVALDTNKTYRWSGTQYVVISETLALGETDSTAYAGSKGKANAEAIKAINDEATGILALAKADATKKAGDAETNAKAYTDQQIEAIEAYTEAEIQAAWDEVFNPAPAA